MQWHVLLGVNEMVYRAKIHHYLTQAQKDEPVITLPSYTSHSDLPKNDPVTSGVQGVVGMGVEASALALG